ncbi:MAG: sulfatase-like hydrolase/transferase, partial [Planctomycetota bacterium]
GEKLYLYNRFQLLDRLDSFTCPTEFSSLTMILIEDLSVLSLIMALSLLPKGKLRITGQILMLALCICFMLDMKSMKYLQSRFTFPIICSYSSEFSALSPFIDAGEIASLSALMLIAFLLRKISIPLRIERRHVAPVLLLLTAAPWILFHNQPLRPLVDLGTRNFIRLNQLLWIDRGFSSESVEKIKKRYPVVASQAGPSLTSDVVTRIPSTDNKPNLIILISESLSQIDSLRSGGVFDRVPMIDKIQADGLTLTNAVSDGPSSSYALAALLLGYETVPTSKPLDEMPKQFPGGRNKGRNLITVANRRGYTTTAITNAGLGFLKTGQWQKDIGFDHVFGRRSELLCDYPPAHFTHCPADEHLYTEALNLLDQQQEPVLMMLTTISLHHPYQSPDPEDAIKDEPPLNSILRYVDRTTYRFYEALKERGFFDNGILLIVGDHRRMDPFEPEELKQRGELDAYGRIVCSLIGPGFEPGRIDDTLFNHSDLNLLLCALMQGGDPDLRDLTRYNKSAYLKMAKPFTTHLISYELGLMVVRIQDEKPVFLQVSGSLDPTDFTDNPVLEKVTAHLVLSIDWLQGRQQ